MRRTAGLGVALAAVALAAARPARAEERVHAPSGLVYEVVRPTGWDGQEPVEVLVCLHGSGDRLANFRRALRVLVPGVRRWLCLFVQSPEERGWPPAAAEGVAALAAEVRAAHPGAGTLLLGYSAGGQAATACLFERPDAFDGALITGAIAHRQPPADARVRARLLYWAVNPDDATFGGAEAVERLRGWLAAAGYGEERYRIDLRDAPGLGHRIDGAAVQRGLDWLRGRGLAAPATDDDRARAADVERLLAARDAASADDLRALAAPIVAGRSAEARALLTAALAPGPGKPRPGPGLNSDRPPRPPDPAGGERSSPPSQPAARPARHAVPREPSAAWPPAPGARGPPSGDGDQAAQVAAAGALARVGGRAEAPALIGALASAERDDRPALVAAIEAALREVTGYEELAGARRWRAWWEQVGKRER
ncbi:MAG: hypothetical protein KF878_16000 [Planctomycetes bacterium]|nr:hypothetical protein [Planctomycetota bacterium]